MVERVDRAIIIGHMPPDHYYRFYERDGRYITEGYFVDDAEAESWFRLHHLEAYKRGIEMRCYDVSKAAPVEVA